MRRLFRGYLAYVRASIAISLQYRVGTLAAAAATLFWILILTRVWSAAYSGRGTVGGFTLETTVVYLTLANLQAFVINSPLSWIIAGRIRTGEVLFDVSRPLAYPGQMLALQAGQSLTQTAIILVISPAAALLGGLSAPSSALYPVALLLGWTLNALLALLIGLSSFWTVDNGGLSTLFRFVAAFLAGSSIPLTFFPEPLRSVAQALPFRFIVYEPAAIYVGRVTGSAALNSLVLALLWIAVLAGVVALVWRRAFRKLVVHGG